MDQNKFFTLTKSLYLGFAAVLLLFIGVTLVGMQKVDFINRMLITINDQNSVRQRYAINFRGSVHDRAIAIRDYVLVPDEGLQEQRNIFSVKEKQYKEAHVALSKIIQDGHEVSPEEREMFKRINAIEAETEPLVKEIKRLRESGETELAKTLLLNQVAGNYIKWLGVINEFIDYQERENKIATASTLGTSNGFRDIMLLLTAVAVALGVGIATLIGKRVSSILGGDPQQAAKIVNKIAKGDLTGTINSSSPASMLAEVASMQTTLHHTFRQLLDNEIQLSQHAKMVADSSHTAQEVAKTQAEISLQSETSIKNIANSISEISQIARQTEQNSEKTTELSKRGSLLVKNAANEMANISGLVTASSTQITELQSRTQEIGGIADVIHEIAEQTNLLALNAAIEAARAGESGRGFAVVADEVRKLAERTSTATFQIAKMIESIQAETVSTVKAMEMATPQVEKGLELANEASTMLEEIYQQAVESTTHAHEVSTAADKQVHAASAISRLMEDISKKSAETNKAMSENTAAVDELEKISESLLTLLRHYKLD